MSEKSFEDWLAEMRNKSDRDVITFKDLRNGGLNKQAAQQVWSEREEAKQKKIRDEEFERIKKLKQEREREHTLWRYWCLADWSERFGMIGVFSGVFLVGYLCAKIDFISRLIDLIRSIKP